MRLINSLAKNKNKDTKKELKLSQVPSTLGRSVILISSTTNFERSLTL